MTQNVLENNDSEQLDLRIVACENGK